MLHLPSVFPLSCTVSQCCSNSFHATQIWTRWWHTTSLLNTEDVMTSPRSNQRSQHSQHSQHNPLEEISLPLFNSLHNLHNSLSSCVVVPIQHLAMPHGVFFWPLREHSFAFPAYDCLLGLLGLALAILLGQVCVNQGRRTKHRNGLRLDGGCCCWISPFMSLICPPPRPHHLTILHHTSFHHLLTSLPWVLGLHK